MSEGIRYTRPTALAGRQHFLNMADIPVWEYVL